MLRRVLPLVLLVTACGTSGPVASSAPTPSPSPAEGVRVTVGPRPCGVLAAAGAVWVSTYGDGSVLRLDARSHRVLSRASTGASPCGLAYGAGSVWVEDYGGAAVTRVDARSGKRRRDYAVGSAPFDVAFAAGAAWSTDNADGTLTRIDAGTGRTTKVRVGGRPTGIAPSAGLLWVADGAKELVEVDPVTSRVVGRLPLGIASTWTAYDGRHVWVSDTPGGAVAVVDTVARAVVATAHVGGRPADGDVVDGVAWFPDRDGSAVVGVDAAGRVAGRHAVELGDPFVVAADGSTLWVADFGGTDVRVLPLG